MTTGSSAAHPHDPGIAAELPLSPGPSGDPVADLVRAAVADRSLEDVVHLVTLLERSPEYARATAAALRAVGTDRSVEDVTRLVALLTRPPRDPDSADEAIRAAAEHRPVEEVTRLVALLNRSELEPHCREEAVRAAATGRPVEELVEMIGRLAVERPAPPDPFAQRRDPSRGGERPPYEVPEPAMPLMPPVPVPKPAPAPKASGRAPAWPGRLAALVLLACGLLCFPAHRDGASLRVYGFAVGVSALCVLLALLLMVRPAVPLLMAAVVVPAGVAAGQLFEGRFRSPGLTRALDLPLAPAWVAGTVGVCAALAALTALVVRLAAPAPETVLTARPLAEAGAKAD